MEKFLSELMQAVDEIFEILSGGQRMFLCFEETPWKILLQN